MAHSATEHRNRAPEWLIVGGSATFVLCLAVSAVFVPDIRWLHVFQASIYAAAAWLSLRGSRWGHFIGISAGGLWNYLFLFASPLFAELLKHPTQPDLVLQGVAALGNFAIIIGAVWAWSRRENRSRADAGALVVTFIVTTGYLAAAIAIFSPGRLFIFRALLHPHWP